MGTFSKGILDGVSGKVISVVAARWSVKNIMRNFQPTPAQIDRRERFSAVMALLLSGEAFGSMAFGDSSNLLNKFFGIRVGAANKSAKDLLFLVAPDERTFINTKKTHELV